MNAQSCRCAVRILFLLIIGLAPGVFAAIGPSNNPPVAVNDTVTVTTGATNYISVLANDYDPDFDPLSINSFTAPAHGSVYQSATQLVYQSFGGYCGPDSFNYQITDNRGGFSSNATVSITVIGCTNSGSNGVIQFTASAYGRFENQAANINVERAGDTTATASVQWMVTGGTATAGSDYTGGTNGTLTFVPGQTLVSLPITIVDDLIAEPDETVSFFLFNPTNASLGSTSFTTLTIFDNDVAASADLQITKTVNSNSVIVGQTVVFQLGLFNFGPNNVTNSISVNEAIPSGFQYVSDTSAASGTTYSAGLGLWTIPNGLGAGSNIFLNITVQAINTGTYTNRATINVPNGVNDSNTNNNSSSAVVTVATPPPAQADLQITKTVNSNSVIVGQTVVFQLGLFNFGPNNVTNSISVNEAIPSGFHYVSDNSFTSGTTYSAGLGLWTIPNGLAAGSNIFLNITVQAINTGTYTNRAIINVPNGVNDPNTNNNSSSAVVTVTNPPPVQADLQITKTASANSMPVGSNIVFNLVLRNNGPGTVTNQIIVTEAIPSGFDYVGDNSAGTGNYYSFGLGQWVMPTGIVAGATQTVAITARAITVGTYTNTAIINVPNGVTDPNTNNNSSSVIVTVTNAPAFNVTGRVLDCTTNGPGLAGVTITLSGATNVATITDASGNYTFSNVVSGAYTVTPSKTNYGFAPASRVINVSGNTTVSNFVGVSFVILGQVREGTNMMPVKPLAAVMIKLTGTQARTNFTDATGSYSFTNLPPGTYAVMPLSNGYCFEPTNVTLYLTNLLAATNNCTNIVNFVATSNAPPGIAIQPLSLTNCISSNMTMSVTVTGCPPFFYQWRYDTNNIPGATNASFTITNLSTTNFGGYTVVITNAFGAVTSAPACLTICVPGLGSRIKVVNVIPNNHSGENKQNSEPSLGVSPSNPGKVIIGTFNQSRVEAPFVSVAVNNPFFLSDAAGGGPLAWSLFDDIVHGDGTVEWSAGGTAYTVLLNNQGNNRINVSSSANPPGGVQWANIAGSTYASGGLPDQPWMKVARVGANDRIYAAFNDLGAATMSATIRFSTDSGATWNNEVIERLAPFTSQDQPAVRVAISSNTVYGAFERRIARGANTNAAGKGDYIVQIIVVRDDNGGLGTGAGRFTALGMNGTNVTATYPVGATNQITVPYSDLSTANPPTITYGTPLGHQDLGSDLAIAADPRRTNRVFVAYAETIAGAGSFSPRVFVARSLDAGQTWQRVFTADTNSAMPMLSIANNGAVGLLYTRFRAGRLETRFTQSADDFTTVLQDIVLASFPDNTPLPIFHPYIGDYEDLESVSNVFYGTFCAGNDPDPANFPEGVYYQRNVKIGGCVFSNFWLTAQGELANTNGGAMTNSAYTPKGVSIDPFFFCLPALGAPSIDLEITKLDAPDPIDLRITNKLIYTIRVTNSGPSMASMIVVTDALPTSVMFVSATNTHGACVFSNGVVTCSVSNLNYRGSATIMITVMPAYAGVITNTATIGAAEADLNPANNIATAVTTVLGPPVPNWSQPPGYRLNPNQPAGEDRPSDFDWRAMDTNCVVADDFRTDGRRIVDVRWWGSYLHNHNYNDEDGYVLSFFTDNRPPGTNSRPGTLLGTYVAPLGMVSAFNTGFIGWDNLFIYEYRLSLSNACLAHADTNYATPTAFLGATNQIYWLAIQAEVGHALTPVTNQQGVIIAWNEADSGKPIATDYFWGWHTSPLTNFDISVTGLMTMQNTNWLYGSWTPNQPNHMELDQAFELFTDAGGPGVSNCPPAFLTIAYTTNHVTLTWTDPAYRLQRATTLPVPQWFDVPGSLQVSLPATNVVQFFRLRCN